MLTKPTAIKPYAATGRFLTMTFCTETFLTTTLLTVTLLMTACAPTVKIAPPDEPIEINLNVKIEHEVTIAVDDTAKPLMKSQQESTSNTNEQ